MFLAGKPVQAVHDFSSLPWTDQLQFLWWLLHTVPLAQVLSVLCLAACTMLSPECAVGAVPAALSAPGNMVMLLFLPSQMTLPVAA